MRTPLSSDVTIRVPEDFTTLDEALDQAVLYDLCGHKLTIKLAPGIHYRDSYRTLPRIVGVRETGDIEITGGTDNPRDTVIRGRGPYVPAIAATEMASPPWLISDLEVRANDADSILVDGFAGLAINNIHFGKQSSDFSHMFVRGALFMWSDCSCESGALCFVNAQAGQVEMSGRTITFDNKDMPWSTAFLYAAYGGCNVNAHSMSFVGGSHRGYRYYVEVNATVTAYGVQFPGDSAGVVYYGGMIR